MDATMVVLRLLHIVGGTYWVGAGLFMVLIVSPTMRALGPQSQPFVTGMFKHTRFAISIPIASLTTVVAGVLLFIKVSDTFNSDWLSSSSGVALTLGSVIGLLAFGHGVTGTRVTMQQLGTLLLALDVQGAPPTDTQRADLGRLQKKLGTHAMLSTMMAVIALLFMAAARYM